MKKKNVLLFVLAIVLILATSVGGALAYFTTFAEAKGGYTIHLSSVSTSIDGTFSDWTNSVIIDNDLDGQPVFVRARAFIGSQYELLYSGEDWTYGDNGFYYFDKILDAGETTTKLLIKIENVPSQERLGELEQLLKSVHFNAIVIYEATPVLYDENGNPYADWSLVIRGND